MRKNKTIAQELWHRKESAIESGNDIIPVSEMNAMNDRESGKAFVGNLLSLQVDVFIQYALNFQTRSGERMFNKFLKHGQGCQGASLHTDGNLRKKAAFNLIVFGTARRIMAYVNFQSGFQRKVRQILLEHPSIVAVAAAAVSGKQKPFGMRIIQLTAQIPPSSQTFHSKFRSVRAQSKVYKALVILNVVESVRSGANG